MYLMNKRKRKQKKSISECYLLLFQLYFFPSKSCWYLRPARHIKCKNDNLVEAIPHIYLSFQQYSCPIWATPISISNTETSQQSQIHPTKPGEHPCFNFNHIKWILSCLKYLTKNVNNKKIHINICSKMIFFLQNLENFQ